MGVFLPELVLGIAVLQKKCLPVSIGAQSISSLSELIPLLDQFNSRAHNVDEVNNNELLWFGTSGEVYRDLFRDMVKCLARDLLNN